MGQGQVNLDSSVRVTGWFAAFERIAGEYFAWYLNGQLVKYVTNSDLKSPYGVPKNALRWMLRLEDAEDGNPTREALVYDWVSLLVPQ